jgi:gluconate 2-dehydrogenase gamma chain
MKITNRRFFLKTIIAGGIALQIPFVFSCNTDSLDTLSITIENNTYNINIDILRKILDILYPNTNFSPGASQLKSDIYYIWILKDNRLKLSKRLFLINNLNKFEQFCIEKNGKSFLKLSQDESKDFVKTVSLTNWGENYLSRVLTIIMESMFANPVYGSNPEKIGWNWINYKGGYPEPQQWNKYPEILSLSK